jgi:hypothetical protein
MIQGVTPHTYATRALPDQRTRCHNVNLGNVVAKLSPRGLCGFRSICDQVSPTILLTNQTGLDWSWKLLNNTYLTYSAARGGADRLEVCGNLGIGGGTTPSLGLVRAIQKALPHLPIMVSWSLCITDKNYVIRIEYLDLFLS